MRLRGFATIAALAALGALAGSAHAQPPTCPHAARVVVAVPDEIDEVRAIVATPVKGAAASVTVVDGHSDRELSVFGAGAWGLTFGHPLPAGRVIVAIDPVVDAPASACIDQVELLRRGAVVARVIPR